MKAILSVMTLVMAASSALACPDLAGNYDCKTSDKKKYKLTIEQTEQEPITFYFIDATAPNDRSDYVIADNKEYKIGKTKKTNRAWCEGEVLKSVTKGKDPFYGRVEYHTDLSIQDGALVIDRTDKSELPIGSMKSVCNPI